MEISYYERISYEGYCRLYQKQVEFRPTALKCLEDIGFRYFWKHRGGSSPDKDFTSMFKNGKPECVGLISFVRGCHVWELDDEYYLINLLRSLDCIDKYGNICYTRTQPGVPIGDYNHTIQSVVHYEDYKPYHDRWVIQIERDRKIGEIV